MTSISFPDLLCLNDYGGDWEVYRDSLYEIYISRIVNANFVFMGLPIKYQFRPKTNGMGFGFWHLISEGDKEEDREINIRRCERIHWIEYILKNIYSDSIKCWENTRKNKPRILFWIEQEKYLLVLEKRRDYFLLKTAFPHTRSKSIKLSREHEKSVDPRKAEIATRAISDTLSTAR